MRRSYGGRRLRKSEQEILQAALAPVMAEARTHVEALERLTRERLVPSVPAELGSVAALLFLDAVAEQLWMSSELAALLQEEPGGEA